MRLYLQTNQKGLESTDLYWFRPYIQIHDDHTHDDHTHDDHTHDDHTHDDHTHDDRTQSIFMMHFVHVDVVDSVM